jgi:uncharacterized protein DUF2637
MTTWQATSEDRPARPDGGLRAVGLAAVCIGVAALAAATFVLSYQGIRAVALQAGIEPRYARGYPLLIDAMLVIVLAAVLALRGAGVPSRMLSWLTLLIVLGAAAGADTLHATGRTLPHNTAVITAAVLPWALVFVAFVLLLAMLRHARLRRQSSAARVQAAWTQLDPDGQAVSQHGLTVPAPSLPVRTPQSWQSDSVSIVPGFSSHLVSSAAAGAAAGAAAVAAAESQVPQDADQEAIAADTSEPVGGAAAEDAGAETEMPDDDLASAVAETELPSLATEPLTDEAEPQADEAEPQADEAEPQADETEPQADEAEPQADETEPQADETEPQADEAEPQADEAEPPTDEAEPPIDEPGPGATEAQAESPEDDDDMPVFHRIRSAPTPPGE